MLSRFPGVLPQGVLDQSEASWASVSSHLLPHTQEPRSLLIRNPATPVNRCGRDLGPTLDGPPPSCPETPQMNPEMGCGWSRARLGQEEQGIWQSKAFDVKAYFAAGNKTSQGFRGRPLIWLPSFRALV